MTINTSLLQTTNDLQQYLVDKETGFPLAAGVITLYKDNSRTYLKNWYYQSGSAPSYTYIPLPNPLTLSSSGTVVDVSGNDVLPFYYPVSETDGTPETYYITVDNSNGQRQFTRQNFPFNGTTENPSATIPTLQNLIVNNNFWRNIESANLTSVTNTVSTGGLCPSAHDGFSMPDLQFFKSISGAAETVSFNKFPLGTTFGSKVNDITPEYYLNHVCTIAGTETYKYYQIPIVLHIKNLESQTATFTIDAQSLGSLASSVLKFGIYQFPGTSSLTPPIPTPITNGTFTLNSVWNRYTSIFRFPSAANVKISDTGDDAIYLVIFIPPSISCNISFTNPSIFLGTTAPTNSFQTYDESDAIIDSPRTGQQIESWNKIPKQGWVPATNISIGTNSSTAVFKGTRTWPLYNLLWNSTTQAVCPVSGGSRGVSAYSDWNANKYLSLPNTMGYVSANLNSDISPQSYTSATTILTLAGGTAGYLVGSPVQVTGTSLGALTANTVYYVTLVTPTTIGLASTIELANAGTPITVGTGSGTILNALGVTQGESSTSQVPNHVHPFTSDHQVLLTGGDPDKDGGTYGRTPGYVTGTTNNPTGGVSSISLYQPTTYINKFIKL